MTNILVASIPVEVIHDAIDNYLYENGFINEDQITVPDLGLELDDDLNYIVEAEIIEVEEYEYDDEDQYSLEFDPLGGGVEEIDEDIEIDEIQRD